MTGINFIDTIVVRQNLERGTASADKPVLPAEFMGKENSKSNEDRLKLAGDLWIMSAKGTSKIKLSEMHKEKTVDLKGHYITTGKGTSRIKI
ncbi:MAG: hypothetical protein OES14_00795 [Nitrosopumilus sp.]|nr:hypothetical protein [Nitrosopumilus sp.]MDH3824313.1 hypothetical protein [Nitrosopumilus sp.]